MTEERMKDTDNFLNWMTEKEQAAFEKTGRNPNTIRTLERDSEGNDHFVEYKAHHGKVVPW